VAGVVHAAGAAVRGDFAELTGSVLDHLLRPKLLGGWRLHRLVADQPLDFFVCFSSIASAWGAKGLAGYAAANQSLDALAHHRRALGLPGVSINWGPWERNVLADAADQAALGRIGVTPISEHDAIAALEQLIAKNAPAQAVAARVDFERLAAVQGAVSSARLFSALVKIPVPPSRRSRPDLVERLTRAPAGERRRIASQVAGEAIARVLGYPPGRALDPRAGFFELGVDSVMALEVRGALEAAFGVELAATVVLDLPNLEALTAHLVDEIFPPVAEPNPAVIRRGPAPASADDSEIAARLSAGIRAAMGDG
jgi:acyl carrier protein